MRKDGIILLRELATEVKNFMDFKMNAVMVSLRTFGLVFCRVCLSKRNNSLSYDLCVRIQRIMDSAEQAALSESEHDGPGQPQSLTKRHYEAHGMTKLVADHIEYSDGHHGPSRKHQRDLAAVQAKPMRRFDKQSVNLSASSILLPTGVDVNGISKLVFGILKHIFILHKITIAIRS